MRSANNRKKRNDLSENQKNQTATQSETDGKIKPMVRHLSLRLQPSIIPVQPREGSNHTTIQEQIVLSIKPANRSKL